MRCKLARLYFGRALHPAFKVIRHEFLRDCLFHRAFDQASRFRPAEEIEEHDAAQDHAAGVDHIEIGILRSGPVGRFKDSEAVADIALSADGTRSVPPTRGSGRA